MLPSRANNSPEEPLFSTTNNNTTSVRKKNQYNSYISIHDLSLESTITYMSPSVKDNIGYEPEELLGKTVHILIHPEDFNNLIKLTSTNLQKPPVAQLLQLRIKHKDQTEGVDGYVYMDVLVNFCYDCFVCFSCRSDETDRSYAWRSSSDGFIRFIDGGKVAGSHLGDRNLIREMLSKQFQWDAALPPCEPRAFIILDRFTRNLGISYASTASALVMDTEPDNLTGRSLYSFVDPNNKLDVQNQVNHVKETQQIAKMLFNWMVDEEKSVFCEAVITITWDALVMIIKRND